VPLLGFGALGDGDWSSTGVELALDLSYGGTEWRGTAYGSWRGLGVGCSEVCFDGDLRSQSACPDPIGHLWLGGGAGAMHDFGRWRRLSYARISLDGKPF
jgi:hypothetical protein